MFAQALGTVSRHLKEEGSETSAPLIGRQHEAPGLADQVYIAGEGQRTHISCMLLSSRRLLLLLAKLPMAPLWPPHIFIYFGIKQQGKEGIFAEELRRVSWNED